MKRTSSCTRFNFFAVPSGADELLECTEDLHFKSFLFKKKLTISTLLFFFTVLDYIFKCLSCTVCFPQKLALGKLLQDLNSCFRDMENLLSGPEGAGVFFMVSETYIISNFTSKNMSCKNVKIIFSKFIKEKSPKIKRWKRMMDYLLLSP